MKTCTHAYMQMHTCLCSRVHIYRFVVLTSGDVSEFLPKANKSQEDSNEYPWQGDALRVAETAAPEQLRSKALPGGPRTGVASKR